jgi:hypothetical protein
MEDDPEVPPKSYPLSPAKMSKTPSWIMLGFVLGVLTVIALPPLRKASPVAAVRETPASADDPLRQRTDPAPVPQLTTIEAVFAEWGKHASWTDSMTEVALWNSHRQSYSDFYEVLRVGNQFYFRTIPALTRREIDRGKPMPESPLKFTETEAEYQEWRQHGRSERSREPVRGSFSPRFNAPAAPPVNVESPKIAPPDGVRVPPAFEAGPAASELRRN